MLDEETRRNWVVDAMNIAYECYPRLYEYLHRRPTWPYPLVKITFNFRKNFKEDFALKVMLEASWKSETIIPKKDLFDPKTFLDFIELKARIEGFRVEIDDQKSFYRDNEFGMMQIFPK